MSVTGQSTEPAGTEDSISEAVVYGVAEATDTDPIDLPPLYDVVDPQALDHLFQDDAARDDPSARLTFTVYGCAVTVYGDGEVDVTQVAEPDSPVSS